MGAKCLVKPAKGYKQIILILTTKERRKVEGKTKIE
jgi:hypothetical protein